MEEPTAVHTSCDGFITPPVRTVLEKAENLLSKHKMKDKINIQTKNEDNNPKKNELDDSLNPAVLHTSSPVFKNSLEKSVTSNIDFFEVGASPAPRSRSLLLGPDEMRKCLREELKDLVQSVFLEKIDQIDQSVRQLRSDFSSRFSELELQNQEIVAENQQLREGISELKMLLEKSTGRGVPGPFTVGWGS